MNHILFLVGGGMAKMSPVLRGRGTLLPVRPAHACLLFVSATLALWKAMAIAPRLLRHLATSVALGGCYPSYLCDVVCSARPIIE